MTKKFDTFVSSKKDWREYLTSTRVITSQNVACSRHFLMRFLSSCKYVGKDKQTTTHILFSSYTCCGYSILLTTMVDAIFVPTILCAHNSTCFLLALPQ